MEDLTEVITSAEFHPTQCNLFAYSSSKGQGFTLVHYSAQPEPFLTQNTP
jgi:hypothetical protein